MFFNPYPLAINGLMGLGAAKPKQTADQKRAAALAKQDQRQAAQLAKAKTDAQRAKIEAQHAKQDLALQKQQQAQVLREQQQAAAKANAEKKRVVSQLVAEIRQIEAWKKQNGGQLPGEWQTYLECLIARTQDTARICSKPSVSLAQAKATANKARAEAAQAARKSEAEKKKILNQIAAEIRQIDAVKRVNPNLPPEWVAYRACLEERLKDVARVCSKPGTTLQQVKQEAAKAKQTAKKEATQAAKDLRKKLAEDKKKAQQQLKEEKKKKDKQVASSIAPQLKQQLAALQKLAQDARAIRKLPKNQQKAAADALIQRSGELLGQDVASRLSGYGLGSMGDCRTVYIPGMGWQQTCEEPRWDAALTLSRAGAVGRGSGMRGMGDVILDPVTGMYVDSATGLPVNDPAATTNFGLPPTSFLPTAPNLPLPKGGCEGKKASKPICMFYTLAAESQQMLYTVVQQIIALQNEILMVLNEIRAGAPITGGGGEGYCDTASGQWINADGTPGGYCAPQQPVTDYPQYPPEYYPPAGGGYPYPPTPDYGGGAPDYGIDYGMDYGGGYGGGDILPPPPQTPYGYNQPYNPYQQIPDTMQLPMESGGGDLFADGGADYIPADAPITQYSQNLYYPMMTPQMDFQPVPTGMEYGSDMFDAGAAFVPQDISIYGAPSTDYQMATPSALAPTESMFVLPDYYTNYAQPEMDQTLMVDAVEPNAMDPFSSIMIPDTSMNEAALRAQQLMQQPNPFNQGQILYDSFDQGGEEDFF